MGTFLILAVIAVIVWLAWGYINTTPEQRKEAVERLRAKEYLDKWGAIQPALFCPHCQTKGFVHAISKKRKKGISGAKATGAVLTLGVSMLATGLSRKEAMTQAHCDNCNSTWDF